MMKALLLCRAFVLLGIVVYFRSTHKELYTSLLRKKYISQVLTLLIALVWLINGLFCKVLNMEPRHQMIVARILGNEYAFILTKAIGIAEILMFIWIISKIKHRLNTIFQMIIVAVMNIIELVLAPDLLLFGRMNIIVAAIFILVIFINEFMLNRDPLASQ